MTDIIRRQSFSRASFTELGIGLIQFLPDRIPSRIVDFKIIDYGFESLDRIANSLG